VHKNGNSFNPSKAYLQESQILQMERRKSSPLTTPFGAMMAISKKKMA